MAQQHKPRHGLAGGAISEGSSPVTHRAGERVPDTGQWACMTCGPAHKGDRVFNMSLMEGDRFPSCPGCGERSVWERAHARRIP